LVNCFNISHLPLNFAIMNKTRFRILVFLMSISLIGIILVQLFWINSSFQKNDEQFRHHALVVLNNVSEKLNKKEMLDFKTSIEKFKDSTGKEPKQEQLKQLFYYEKDVNSKEILIYTNAIVPEDFGIDGSLFDKKLKGFNIKEYSAKRKTQIFKDNSLDGSGSNLSSKPSETIEKSGDLTIFDIVQFELLSKDILSKRPIQQRISSRLVNDVLNFELHKSELKTPYEFAVYKNGLATKVKSEEFRYDKCTTFSVPILLDADGKTEYKLLLRFPNKVNFVFSSMLPMTILTLLFVVIILVTYTSALKQLIMQKQISEIKTDFINNMTHEFKTPIATINLALDAIKNPKIIDDKEKVQKYLQMIKDENKRMHAQVENVLRISKLERNELNIDKEPQELTQFIEDAIDHISLILEDREGEVHTHFNASRTTVLLNDVHFTNVLVNILDNAMKYSAEKPIINIYTENIKDSVLIKIEDNGIGMSKAVQKKVFEKFFREHTGDLHNVKGHGLGLAYVKQIVDDHNGEVFVESEKGKGSTFIIKLPLIN
jgi:two-component system, OmpR family, phosphate regulon sensor histidine kinase PhoR